MKYHCTKCKKVIIQDIEKYLKKYSYEKYIQCCYCNNHILIEEVKRKIKN